MLCPSLLGHPPYHRLFQGSLSVCYRREKSLGVHLVDVPPRGGALAWNRGWPAITYTERDVYVITTRVVLNHLPILDLCGWVLACQEDVYDRLPIAQSSVGRRGTLIEYH